MRLYRKTLRVIRNLASLVLEKLRWSLSTWLYESVSLSLSYFYPFAGLFLHMQLYNRHKFTVFLRFAPFLDLLFIRLVQSKGGDTRNNKDKPMKPQKSREDAVFPLLESARSENNRWYIVGNRSLVSLNISCASLSLPFYLLFSLPLCLCPSLSSPLISLGK